jgi:hypothetical protein
MDKLNPIAVATQREPIAIKHYVFGTECLMDKRRNEKYFSLAHVATQRKILFMGEAGTEGSTLTTSRHKISKCGEIWYTRWV